MASDKLTASLTVPVRISADKTDVFIDSLKNIKRDGCDSRVSKMVATMANDSHPDLMYGSAILVSTVVNKNDDMFLPEETWEARHTPVNTPYNVEHEETDIIGHIIASRPLDSAGKLIESETPPKNFDIEVDFVVYQSIFPAIAKDILEKAPKGEKFVSMEAKFNNFDYALQDKERGGWKIIARNKETSFLTKHLRIYGGLGSFQDQKVVRVPRGFRFTGMGSVEVPANPTSEYTRFDKYETASQNSVIGETSPKVVLYITKGNIMKVETLEQAQQVIAQLTEKLSAFEGKESQTLQARVTALETEKQTLAGQVTAESEKARLANEALEASKAEVTAAKTELQTIKDQLTAKAAELEQINKQKTVSERVAKLTEAGYPITDQKKVEIADWSEQTFASVYDFAKSLKSDDKDKGNTGDAAAAAAATTQAQATLDKAQADNKADVTKTEGDVETEGDKLQKAAAKLANMLVKSKQPNKANSNKGNKKE